MRHLAKLGNGRLAAWTKPLPRFTVGAAWFFILFSLAHLAWVVGVKWGDPSGLTTLYQTTVLTTDGPEIHRAWGMAYDGTAGLLLALVQAAAVVAATVLSMRPAGRARRIGHAVLVAWAAMWLLNLLNLSSVDGRLDSFAQAGVMAVLFAATVFRAARRPRTPRPKNAMPPPMPEADSPLTAEQIASSDRVREIEFRVVDPGTRPASPRLARVKDLGRRAANRVKPAATAARRRVGEAGRWLTTRLRASGVLPRGQHPTST